MQPDRRVVIVVTRQSTMSGIRERKSIEARIADFERIIYEFVF